ncbi:MAG: hypothetical protein ACSLE8_21260 [Rhodococcus sp. (in: high G+C Gram-positive bacteria)]
MTATPKRLEDFLRAEDPDDWELVIRGRQFDPGKLLDDALDMLEIYTWNAKPVAAVSASVVRRGQTVDELLNERRLRTRRDVVIAPVADVVAAGFPVLATFDAPHVSIVLLEPTLVEATRLRELFGDPTPNPHYDGKRKKAP